MLTKNIKGIAVWAKSADNIHVTLSYTIQHQSIDNTQKAGLLHYLELSLPTLIICLNLLSLLIAINTTLL